MRGVTSQAMLLCASIEEKLELLEPPIDCKPGDRIFFQGYEHETPEDQLNPKKKLFEQIQPHLLTNDFCVANYKNLPFQTEKGVCTVKSLKKATIR